MRGLLVVLALGASLGCGGGRGRGATDTSPEPAIPPGDGVGAVDELAWLASSWRTQDGTEITLEAWSGPRGGVLYGYSHTSVGGEMVHHELLRIWRRGGELSLLAAPSGQAPASFALVESGAGHAAFANPSHDFPKRIEYRRDGDRLVARISGDADQRSAEWRYERASAAGFGTANVTLCRDGRVTVEPCHCAPHVLCGGVDDAGTLDLALAVLSAPCEACEEAQGACPLDGHEGPVTIHGAPVLPAGATGCATAEVPVMGGIRF